MSKICEGTILTPMKGADLIKQQTTEAAKTDSRYLPPWMRKAVLDEKKKNELIDEKYVEQIQTLQDKNAELELKVNSGSSYLRDQNETLLQEIRRLNAELSASRSR